MSPLLHLAGAILGANLPRAHPRPYKLTFSVTNRCNARCRHCHIWHKPEPSHPLTPDEIDRLFTRYPHWSWIDLTGGEPLLRPDLLEIVAIILRRVPRLYHLHLPTNAVSPALTIQRIGQILALNPPRLTVTLSLDGPPDRHDALRGVPGNWEGVMTLFDHFNTHPDPRLQLYFGFTLSDHTVGTLGETMRLVHARFPNVDARHWHVNIAHHSAHYYDNADTPLLTPERTNACADEITDLRDRKKARRFIDPVAFLECLYLNHARPFLGGRTHPLPCRAVDTSLFLAADGTLYPCSIWDRPLGNLRDHAMDLTALLAHAPARACRAEIRAARCPGCWTPCDAYPTILNNLLPDLSGNP
ncbi:MAG: radical SAM protein [Magnetococcales bacterium]|nr:radical SAM protein [Magnetococcales bacterium]